MMTDIDTRDAARHSDHAELRRQVEVLSARLEIAMRALMFYAEPSNYEENAEGDIEVVEDGCYTASTALSDILATDGSGAQDAPKGGES